ncbi:MAG: tetratricopeptide repeat protein [Armatimonadetes bacterium]|nr:tetratricopeptide repeat protein [Armatimonadota bacterium]NIM24627.1 tetratricopeptide repeat protein [Armatimonadota bacterium]NIM68506.1 tetratricopeptide repeat protein [Armatimonadota bacterium]NIM76888.1 tetratricopeptide repeat protein [Armatimonadota bacterium]NIN06700.1 tetratricopeptide repeat protein [Armatimonadota bacterium]
MVRPLFAAWLALSLFALTGCGPVEEYAASKSSERLLAEGLEALKLGDDAKAETAFRQAASLKPSGDVVARIGLAYHFDGRFEQALPWLEKAFKFRSDQPWSVHVARAAGYAASGQPEIGIRLMQDAHSNMPDDAYMLNNVTYVMADAGLLLDEVIVVLEKAVKQAPGNGVVLDSLGWAYFRQGRVEQALPILEEAERLSRNGEIKAHVLEARRALQSRKSGQ